MSDAKVNETIARKTGVKRAALASFTLGLWACLPLRWVHAIGAALGLLIWWLSPSYRAKITRFCDAAGVAQGLRPTIVKEIGRWAAETPWIWWRPISEIAAMVEGDWAATGEVLAQGKGLIILTPHMGSFEAAARSYSCRHPVTVMFKPPKQAWLAKVLEGARATSEIMTAPASLAGVKQLVRFLRQGGTTAILPDQVPGEGEGQWATLFGQPAYTMTLPTRLAALSGAPIVLLTCLRKPKGQGWKLHFEPIDLAGGIPRTAQDVNELLERLILKFPEQYLWAYNRFRGPRKEAK